MNTMIKLAILSIATLGFSISLASAQSSGSTPKSDTTYVPVYNKGNFSAGGYATTTTTGGYSTGGSGQAIPNNTRGSTQDTSRGVGFTYTFK